MTLKKPEILDSTLRDGLQSPRTRDLAVPEALLVIDKIRELGYAAVIEAGFAGSNDNTDAWIKQSAQSSKGKPAIASFGRVRLPRTSADDYGANPGIEKIMEAATPVVVLVGKAWDWHVAPILATTLEENLSMIYDTVKHFTVMGKRVIFDAEFATGGFLGNPSRHIRPNFDYTLETLQAAIEGGADTVVLCDTTGIMTLDRIPEMIKRAMNVAGSTARIGFHAHNDHGLATALSILAWQNGASHLQVCMNGIGERAGNASALEIMALLNSPYEAGRIPFDLKKGSRISNEVYLITTGRQLPPSTPHFGIDAFAHKGGMHADGNAKLSGAYEGRNPEEFGNTRRYPFSLQAGAAHIASLLGIPKDSHARKVYQGAMQLQQKGYDFDAAVASLYVLSERLRDGYEEPFRITETDVRETTGLNEARSHANLTVKIRELLVDAHSESRAGQVDSITTALLSSLSQHYRIPNLVLLSYKAEDITRGGSALGTDKVVRVTTSFKLNGETYTTMGVSPSVVEASSNAISDGITYAMLKKEPTPAQHTTKSTQTL